MGKGTGTCAERSAIVFEKSPAAVQSARSTKRLLEWNKKQKQAVDALRAKNPQEISREQLLAQAEKNLTLRLAFYKQPDWWVDLTLEIQGSQPQSRGQNTLEEAKALKELLAQGKAGVDECEDFAYSNSRWFGTMTIDGRYYSQENQLWDKELVEEKSLQKAQQVVQGDPDFDRAMQLYIDILDEEEAFRGEDKVDFQQKETYFFQKSILEGGNIDWISRPRAKEQWVYNHFPKELPKEALSNQLVDFDEFKVALGLEVRDENGSQVKIYPQPAFYQIYDEEVIQRQWENFNADMQRALRDFCKNGINSLEAENPHEHIVETLKSYVEYMGDKHPGRSKLAQTKVKDILKDVDIVSEKAYNTFSENGEEVLEAHMKVRKKYSQKLEAMLHRIGAQSEVDDCPYPFYTSSHALRACASWTLQKDDMKLRFVPYHQEDLPKGRWGSLSIEGGSRESQIQLLKNLKIAEGLSAGGVDKQIHGDYLHQPLRIPKNQTLMHGVTGVNNQKDLELRLKNIVDAGGLLSISERSKRRIAVNSLSPIGDAVSGIDGGVPTSFQNDCGHGTDLWFGFHPSVIARKELVFAPMDWGAGDRSRFFSAYKRVIGQKETYPDKESRENHFSTFAFNINNECYVKESIGWEEIDTVWASSKAFESTRDIIRKAQRAGKIPARVKVSPVAPVAELQERKYTALSEKEYDQHLLSLVLPRIDQAMKARANQWGRVFETVEYNKEKKIKMFEAHKNLFS